MSYYTTTCLSRILDGPGASVVPVKDMAAMFLVLKLVPVSAAMANILVPRWCLFIEKDFRALS